MRVSTKILIPVVILAAVAVLIAGLALAGLTQIRATTADLTTSSRIVATASEMRSISRALQRDALNLIFEPGGDPGSLRDRFNRRVDSFTAQVDRLVDLMTAAGNAGEAREIARLQDEVLAALAAVRDAALAGDPDTAHRTFIDRVRPAEREASALTDPVIEDGRARIATLEAGLADTQRLLILVILTAAVLGIAAGVTVATMVSRRSIVRPLERLTAVMERLQGKDFQARVPDTDRSDEIGTMARAIGVFRDAMADGARLAAEAAAEQKRREEAQRRLTDLVQGFAGELNAIAADLARDADGLARDADGLLQSATTSAEAAGRAATTAQQTSGNVQLVADATDQLSNSIREISASAGEAAAVATEGSTLASRAAEDIQVLKTAANQIGAVVTLITDIAEQTNLLALNATIEAARAGEAGKGFAVVANEVKGLAGQTGSATTQIRDQVETVQQATDKAVTAIGRIVDMIGRINGMTTSIAAAVEQQATATSEITRNVQEAAAGVDAIAGSIGSVTSATDAANAASRRVDGASEQMAGKANRLKTDVEGFIRDLDSVTGTAA